MHHELLGTRRLIAECGCENGCPGASVRWATPGRWRRRRPFGSSIGCSRWATSRTPRPISRTFAPHEPAGSPPRHPLDAARDFPGRTVTSRPDSRLRPKLCPLHLPNGHVSRGRSSVAVLGGPPPRGPRPVLRRGAPPHAVDRHFCTAASALARWRASCPQFCRDRCAAPDAYPGRPSAVPLLRYRDQWSQRRGGHVCIPHRLRLVWRRRRIRDRAGHVLARHHDERAMLEVVGSRRTGACRRTCHLQWQKSFDAPVVEMRCLFHRLEWTGGRPPAPPRLAGTRIRRAPFLGRASAFPPAGQRHRPVILLAGRSRAEGARHRAAARRRTWLRDSRALLSVPSRRRCAAAGRRSSSTIGSTC